MCSIAHIYSKMEIAKQVVTFILYQNKIILIKVVQLPYSSQQNQ
jgi:hypothetical protein